MRFLIFTCAEIDVLRLCAWCKDLPVGYAEILPQETIMLLSQLKLMRESRCKMSYRITSEGYNLLHKFGYDYEKDKQYRGKGAVLTRRLETAKITSFFGDTELTLSEQYRI